MKNVVLITTVLALVACQSTMPEQTERPKEKIVMDDIPMKPRSQQMMCTMQYDPVCATFEIDGKMVQKTFGNSCGLGSVAIAPVKTVNGACQ